MLTWIYGIGVMLSQVVCILFYGQNPDKSLSQLHGQVKVEGHVGMKLWMWILFWHSPWVMEAVRRIINAFFCWEEQEVDWIVCNGQKIRVGHCEQAYLTKYERNTSDVVKLARSGNI
jgi:hypothetical protein